MLTFRNIELEEINRSLFGHFIRRQEVVKCWRHEKGEWVIRDDPFTDDWSEEDYAVLIGCLKNTVKTGGFVYGAFRDGELKGFVSVEPGLFGGEQRYIDLSSIHVSEEMRGSGIGRTLFEAAKGWAKKQGARKLYISAHSAVESQAFYKKMGCRKRSCTIRDMWRQSRMTASWNARWSNLPPFAAFRRCFLGGNAACNLRLTD